MVVVPMPAPPGMKVAPVPMVTRARRWAHRH